MNDKTANTSGRTHRLILCALFAAVTAICSIITIPLGFTPVPINLGTLAVFITGGILGRKYGTVSIIVYVLLGACGLPVFSGFRGGVSVLAGPTGGYIIGYIFAVFVTGLIIDRICEGGQDKKSGRTLLLYAAAMIAGLLICYSLGTAWFMISTSSPLWTSLLSCVIPFLPGDALKILAAALLVKRLRPAITR